MEVFDLQHMSEEPERVPSHSFDSSCQNTLSDQGRSSEHHTPFDLMGYKTNLGTGFHNYRFETPLSPLLTYAWIPLSNR